MNNKRFPSSLTHIGVINHENSRDFNLYCFLYTSHISDYLWSLANISRISLRSRTSSEGSSGAGSSMGLSFFRWKLLIAFTTVKITSAISRKFTMALRETLSHSHNGISIDIRRAAAHRSVRLPLPCQSAFQRYLSVIFFYFLFSWLFFYF